MDVGAASRALHDAGYRNSQDAQFERSVEFFEHLLRDTGDRARAAEEAFAARKKQRDDDEAAGTARRRAAMSQVPDSFFFLLRVRPLRGRAPSPASRSRPSAPGAARCGPSMTLPRPRWTGAFGLKHARVRRRPYLDMVRVSGRGGAPTCATPLFLHAKRACAQNSSAILLDLFALLVLPVIFLVRLLT